MRRPLRHRFVPALLAATALVGASCSSSGGSPQEELQAAMTALGSEDFNWELEIEASSGLLASAGQQSNALAGASQFITGFRLAGARVGDDTELQVRVLGADVVQLRFLDGGDKTFAKFEVGGLLGFAGIDGSQLLADLGTQGLSPNLQALAGAAIGSEWIAVEVDADDLSGLASGATGTDADAQAAYDALQGLAEDPGALLARIGTVTELDGEGDGRQFEVAVNVRDAANYLFDEVLPALASSAGGDQAVDLAEARAELETSLAEAPETVNALRATVVDGKVTSIVIDLDEIIRAAGQPVDEGEDAALVLSFDRSSLPTIDAPTPAATLTAEDLTALMGLATL